MRKNYSQTGIKGEDQRFYIEGDWFSNGLPPNVIVSENVYIDTSYGFASFHSMREKALFIDEGSGFYDRSNFISGCEAQITVGKYCILNGTTIIANKEVIIGNHCMLAWGSVITDTWLTPPAYHTAHRRKIMQMAAAHPMRIIPPCAKPDPVTLEDNCWIGFGAVILPGVRIGRGAIVGCKTIVREDVPPYAIVIGDPCKIIKYLIPDDTEAQRQSAFQKYSI